MKNVKLLFIAAFAIAAAASCNKNTGEKLAAVPLEDGPRGSIQINIAPDIAGQTKASPYITTVAQETNIEDYQVLIFRNDGSLARYLSGTNDEPGFAELPSIEVPVGRYSVYAVANGPSAAAVTTKGALDELLAPLAEYNDSEKLVQYGMDTCTVTEDETEVVEVELARLVARIHLESVRNNLPAAYGSVRLKHVFLANVVANENLSCSTEPQTWYNRYARTSAQTPAIIDGSSNHADAEDITFKATNLDIAPGASITNVANLYCYKNDYSNTPGTYSAVFSPCATLCVLAMEIGGQTYYYPVNIADRMGDPNMIEANNSYSIAVTITNLGSTEPSIPVKKGSLEIRVYVGSWSNGGSADVEL